MNNLKTTIGLEIHVQLKTKSKMFCRCNNEAFGAKPNTTVCPVCLGMPGVLPVANKQAILWTVKTGLALNCEIPKIAKFDRKHYFYPDLPKGYQVSQFDEPFCVGGFVEIGDRKIKLTRIHLEEDAGKLIHSGGKSLVDLNRAGTPLMEIVSEPDITSPEEAGAYLRKIQKIVRDVVSVSEASMEKGHLRCDANISISQISNLKSQNNETKMSQIIELKNLNSFRFVEKALALAEQKLKSELKKWPHTLMKETWGYDSKKNQIFIQRQKEEASDYRYFPEPDLPPVNTTTLDLEAIKFSIGKNHEELLEEYLQYKISKSDAYVLVSDRKKGEEFAGMLKNIQKGNEPVLATAIVQNYFRFKFDDTDSKKYKEYGLAVNELAKKTISKQIFQKIVTNINKQSQTYNQAFSQLSGGDEKIDIEATVSKILKDNPAEVSAYKSGKKQLLGFFIGQALKETAGRADPREVSDLIKKRLRE